MTTQQSPETPHEKESKQSVDSTACLQVLLNNLHPVLESLQNDVNSRSQRYVLFQEILYVVATITAFLIGYLFYLVYMVTMDMHKLTDYMETVSTHFVAMSKNVEEMRTEMRTITQHSGQVSSLMSNMEQTMKNIQTTMGQMQTTMHTMAGAITHIDQNITANLGGMQTNLHDINQRMTTLTEHIGQIRTEMQEIRTNTNAISFNLRQMTTDMNVLTRSITPLVQRFNNLPWSMMPSGMPMFPFF
ncbi:methyl-accepting chemotaxis protein [Beggiatoa alba]|uniref:methyl-accepting chemotaxis protein n=1 Tax=Beggiatoa alba TaxID=1022 RepID=UPI0002F5499C|nr:methyl-accepting chemotaxis protein [Beggiatoa alba]